MHASPLVNISSTSMVDLFIFMGSKNGSGGVSVSVKIVGTPG